MLDEQSKQTIDVIAASTGILSLAAWLPPLASLFTIVWLGIRIYETDTVQKLIKKGRNKR
tara:strand:- start:1090 stop:1269 length:180 start_codon:yes stop_codon:yes gene_type:complete